MNQDDKPDDRTKFEVLMNDTPIGLVNIERTSAGDWSKPTDGGFDEKAAHQGRIDAVGFGNTSHPELMIWLGGARWQFNQTRGEMEHWAHEAQKATHSMEDARYERDRLREEMDYLKECEQALGKTAKQNSDLRIEVERLRYDYELAHSQHIKLSQHFCDLEEECDRLRAENEDLRTKLSEHEKDGLAVYGNKVSLLHGANADLREENAKLRGALEFYAHINDKNRGLIEVSFDRSLKAAVFGERARKVLAECAKGGE